MDLVTGGFQHRPHERDQRSLGVGPGDMNDRRQLPFGMAQTRKQGFNPTQSQIDNLGM